MPKHAKHHVSEETMEGVKLALEVEEFLLKRRGIKTS